MVGSMTRTAELLRGRFLVSVALADGETLPILESNALDRKFGEYLERARARQLKESQRLGGQHTDYETLMASLPSDKRQEAENRATAGAWSAAKGPFLEALCLLADVVARQSNDGPVPLCLFGPVEQIRLLENGRERFIWSQPQMVGTRSGMVARPDIVITTEPVVSVDTIVAVRECKCHRRIRSDEIRKECGKATDLEVSSYVLVSYYTVPHRQRRGAEGLGLRIEELALDGPTRTEYVKGERNLVVDLARRLHSADDEAWFRTVRERGAALARVKEERGR
jgi:hypothetical protein